MKTTDDKVESRTELAAEIVQLCFTTPYAPGRRNEELTKVVAEKLAARPSVPAQGEDGCFTLPNGDCISEGKCIHSVATLIRCANCGQFIIAGAGIGCISIGEGEAACSNFCADEHERLGCPQESGTGYRDVKWYAALAASRSEAQPPQVGRQMVSCECGAMTELVFHPRTSIECWSCHKEVSIPAGAPAAGSAERVKPQTSGGICRNCKGFTTYTRQKSTGLCLGCETAGSAERE